MAMADDKQVAREREARESFSPHASEFVDAAAIKRLLLEFRQRLAAAAADMLPSASAESRALLVENFDRGRRGFGRIFHAALFFYQKVRAFLPSELQESLHDPLSKIVPFPFYVLPYKAKHAMHRSLTSLVRGVPKQRSPSSSPARTASANTRSSSPAPARAPAIPAKEDAGTREEWFRKRISELEERLPLASTSKVEVPHFIAHLLHCRALANSGVEDADIEDEAHLRDRFDVLLADAFTVYMSAWRTAGSNTTATTTTQSRPGTTTQVFSRSRR